MIFNYKLVKNAFDSSFWVFWGPDGFWPPKPFPALFGGEPAIIEIALAPAKN